MIDVVELPGEMAIPIVPCVFVKAPNEFVLRFRAALSHEIIRTSIACNFYGPMRSGSSRLGTGLVPHATLQATWGAGDTRRHAIPVKKVVRLSLHGAVSNDPCNVSSNSTMI